MHLGSLNTPHCKHDIVLASIMCTRYWCLGVYRLDNKHARDALKLANPHVRYVLTSDYNQKSVAIYMTVFFSIWNWESETCQWYPLVPFRQLTTTLSAHADISLCAECSTTWGLKMATHPQLDHIFINRPTLPAYQ